MVYDSGTLVEYHIETHMFGGQLRIINGKFVVVIDDTGRQDGKVQQPLRVLAEYEVIAIASANTDMSGIDMYFRCLWIPFLQLICCPDAATLKSKTCEP